MDRVDAKNMRLDNENARRPKNEGPCLFTNRALEAVDLRTSLTLNDLYV